MKLDVTMFRYITREEFRVLTAVEMGMRNHEHVPGPLVESISKLNRSLCYKTLQSLLRNKLVAHDGQAYDGWRLTYHGYDFLALRALAARGTLLAVGRRLGVGKESDVHFAQGPDGELVALKLHRLGRISFRAIKEKRDYLRHRVHASWMYMAKLAAAKEFAYMRALKDEGFPVPTPIDQNRHAVVMSFVRATPLFQIRTLKHPHQALERLMRLVVRLLRAGIVHGDFNEFNLMLDEDEKITLIDFPQIVYNTHPNAEEFFDRDVRSIVEFFRKRLNIEVQEWPIFSEALGEDQEDEVQTLQVPGFKREDDALLVAAHEQSRASGQGGGSEEEEEEEEEAEESVHQGFEQLEGKDTLEDYRLDEASGRAVEVFAFVCLCNDTRFSVMLRMRKVKWEKVKSTGLGGGGGGTGPVGSKPELFQADVLEAAPSKPFPTVLPPSDSPTSLSNTSLETCSSEPAYSSAVLPLSESKQCLQCLRQPRDFSSARGLETKQCLRHRWHKERLRSFLQKHNFQSVNKPRSPSSFAIFSDYNIYPVHVAARLGDYQILRLLLAAAADPEQRTAWGRRAMDIAVEANKSQSHEDVLGLLSGRVKAMAVRELRSLRTESL
ncbi:unnamed protein product [Effrenium voratum]|nr:unnamed protein product [Effrenium voratum]